MRGGKREGSGRPPALNSSRHNIFLPDHIWKYLTDNGNASQTITKLLEEKMEQQARARIDKMGFAPSELEFIWADWPNWTEHINWLLTASHAEIQSWIDAAK